MDEWLWIITLIVIFYFFNNYFKKIKPSEKYLQEQKRANIKYYWLIVGGTISFFSGVLCIAFNIFELGILVVVVGISFFVWAIIGYNKAKKRLNKIETKEEKKQLYEEELIKEKARLQARKEHRKGKKK